MGGDLYAVQDTPFGVRILLADVRGEGLPGRHRVRPRGRVPRGGRPGADLVVLAEGLEDALDCGTQSPGAFERRFQGRPPLRLHLAVHG